MGGGGGVSVWYAAAGAVPGIVVRLAAGRAPVTPVNRDSAAERCQPHSASLGPLQLGYGSPAAPPHSLRIHEQKKMESLERIHAMRETNGNFDSVTYVTYINGWFPAVYMNYTNQNFRLFHVSNLSILNSRNFLLMYPGSLAARCGPARHRSPAARCSKPAPKPAPDGLLVGCPVQNRHSRTAGRDNT